MKHIVLTVVLAGLFTGCASDGETSKQTKKNMSHAHIKHVSTSWKDTPKKAGLMDTAKAEAKIAAQHAGAAAKKTHDLAWMKMHTKHVIHAVDPGKLAKGPGLGYGVIKASNGVAKHIEFAAASPEATDYLKLHAVHVATSAKNSAQRGEKIIQLSEKLLATNNTRTAAKLVRKISALSEQLLKGVDANSDGKISWHKGEGGLVESEKHLGFIRKHEGV